MASFLTLPTPTPDELRAFRRTRDWSARECAQFFGYGDGRRWREFEAGDRPIDPARWSLALLELGEHPTYRIRRRIGELRGSTVEIRKDRWGAAVEIRSSTAAADQASTA
jgi:hypothetical protein